MLSAGMAGASLPLGNSDAPSDVKFRPPGQSLSGWMYNLCADEVSPNLVERTGRSGRRTGCDGPLSKDHSLRSGLEPKRPGRGRSRLLYKLSSELRALASTGWVPSALVNA